MLKPPRTGVELGLLPATCSYKVLFSHVSILMARKRSKTGDKDS